MFTAIVQLKIKLPKHLKENSLYAHQFGMGDGDIIFDQSFHGLSQQYDPTVDSTESSYLIWLGFRSAINQRKISGRSLRVSSGV